jgi:hypothetical protein
MATDALNEALFYAGYAAILTPAFGISAAYADNPTELNNGLGFWVLRESNAKTDSPAHRMLLTVFCILQFGLSLSSCS